MNCFNIQYHTIFIMFFSLSHAAYFFSFYKAFKYVFFAAVTKYAFPSLSDDFPAFSIFLAVPNLNLLSCFFSNSFRACNLHSHMKYYFIINIIKTALYYTESYYMNLQGYIFYQIRLFIRFNIILILYDYIYITGFIFVVYYISVFREYCAAHFRYKHSCRCNYS